MLLLRAKTHDILNAEAVIPAPVKDHDLPRCREVLHVTLHIHLRFLAVGRRRQRYRTEYPGADPLRQSPDGASFAGGVAALEYDDHAQPLVFDPLLEFAQLRLELAQFPGVFLGLQFPGFAVRGFAVLDFVFLAHGFGFAVVNL